MTGTTTTTDTRMSEVDLDGDHDRFAHYAQKAAVSRAYVTGEEIVALCGKRFVPTRDPSRYPVCPTCKDIVAAHNGG
ncbi:MAG: DUF3039 domain-containing protein [Acidimicrobiales bacterium]